MQETARCFNHFYNYKGAFLTEEMTVNLVGLMGKVLEQVTIDKEQRIAQFQTYKKKMTEEEVEEFEENVQKIDKCWTYVMEITSVLLRNMSEVASPEVLKRLVPKYAKILQEEDRKDYDYRAFLEDIEEDPEVRQNVNKYRDEDVIEELLGKLSLNPTEPKGDVKKSPMLEALDKGKAMVEG